ncbi:hypothetical protein D3C85_1066560 [compost metagenome]
MRGFVAVVTSLAFMGGVANAQQACEGATITNTGPGSTNEVTCVDSREVTVTCVNDIYVVNNNSQTGGSGDADNSGNTTGGSSISGNATNENGATVQIGAACAAQPAAVTPETPTPSQPVGGMGAGAPTEAAKVIAALPNTSGGSLLDSILIGSASLAGLLVASRLGMTAYRRATLR